MRGGDTGCDWHAGGLLARVFELARQISARIAGGAAVGVAADGARILRAGGHGAARAAWEIVDGAVRAWAGIHVRRAATGVRAVQFSVCGAALDGLLRRSRSKIAGCVGRAGRGTLAHILARNRPVVAAGSGDSGGAEFRAYPGGIRRGADGGREFGGSDANSFDRLLRRRPSRAAPQTENCT